MSSREPLPSVARSAGSQPTPPCQDADATPVPPPTREEILADVRARITTDLTRRGNEVSPITQHQGLPCIVFEPPPRRRPTPDAPAPYLFPNTPTMRSRRDLAKIGPYEMIRAHLDWESFTTHGACRQWATDAWLGGYLKRMGLPVNAATLARLRDKLGSAWARPANRLTRASLPRIDPGIENRAGFTRIVRPESPVILHVPHAGLAWPDDGTADPDYRQLAREITLMADLLVDQVADIVEALLNERDQPKPSRFQSLLSRVAMDPERFDDDTEEMNRVGMGVVYERTHTGRLLYSAGLTVGDTVRRKHVWHRPYAQALSTLVDQTLARHGRCLIVDLHSYSVRPLAYEPHQRADRPAVCLGSEPFHDPGIDHVERIFAERGIHTGRNSPFQGSYVPTSQWRRSPAVHSLMVEIRKDQYLDGEVLRPGGALRVAEAMAEVIVDWVERTTGGPVRNGATG